MTLINRVRVGWSGFIGAPGVSTFYFDSTTSDLTPLKTFLTVAAGFIPSICTLALPGSGDQIDDTNGVISGVWTATGAATLPGTGGSTAYAGSAGFVVDWLSGTVVAGRRRMGRTYFVPATQSTYQTDGTIIEAARTSLLNAGNIMLTAFGPKFVVWSRPFPGKAATVVPPIKPAKPARSGIAVPVVGCRVPDIAAVLRSRRQ